jgi:hypothetical protein
MKSILSREFKYVPACATTPEYLREKFAQIARQMAASASASKPKRKTKRS